MKLEELNKYNFHDTTICEIKKVKKDVIFNVKFCLTWNNDCDKNMPWQEDMKLIFKNADSNLYGVFEMNHILTSMIENNKIIFHCIYFYDDNEDEFDVVVNASSVEVKEGYFAKKIFNKKKHFN